ncbi:MAG: hypothetical protein SPJ23_05215 [Eubacteriales bacterium]|nr:hypothetical protein [Eubacteriales bacterium]
MKTIDLSQSKNIHDMLVNAEFSVACVRAEGGGILKFIHASLAQRDAFRAHLRKAQRLHNAKEMIPGERFSLEDNITRYLCSLDSGLSSDPDLGKGNNLITVIRI